METPNSIIYSYTKDGGYTYLNIPVRLVKQCGIVSGNRFIAFIRGNKLVIEQEVKNGDVFVGPGAATSN